MNLRKILLQLLYSLPFVFVFVGSLFQPNDPDLGWHLKYGQYFFDHLSILRSNTFSTDMPTYHWVNLSWGTDLISYAIFALGGFLGLTLVASAVVTLTFYLFSKAFELDFFEKVLIFPFLIYVEDSLIVVGFRGQLLSILFLGFMTYVLMRYEKGFSKLINFLPLLFLVWANIHGQFVVGLGIFAVWIVGFLGGKFFQTKRLDALRLRRLCLIFVFSILATLVNPFGYGLYSETFRYINNPLLFAIAEYLPPPQLTQVWWNHILTGFLVLIGIIIFIFSGEWKKKFSSLGIFGVLYLMSFMVKRYSWSMYYFIIPFLKPVASFIKPDKKLHTNILGGVIIIAALAYVTVLRIPFTQFADMSWDIFCKDYFGCSTKAAEVMEKRDNGRLFNLYAWGGWLIWEHPKVPVSMDGRMHLWRDERGYSAYEKYFDYEQNVKDIDKSTYDTVYVPRNKPIFYRMVELFKAGKWRAIYEDDLSAIFVRAQK